MAKLAIEGHATRGKEVIEILEMLGGKNPTKLKGNTINHVYIINSSYYGEIYCLGGVADIYNVFTLEQFLEKFPYKVGDKVNVCGENAALVIGMRWESDYVLYRVRLEKNGYETSKTAGNLQPHKEETMEESMKMNIVNNDCNNFKINTTTELCENKVITFAKCTLDEVEIDLADKFEIVLKEGKYFAVKKRPKYPKTYEECCDILRMPNGERYIDVDVPLSYNALLKSFTQLLICRDAYWKMAGDWKPKWNDNKTDKYIITNFRNAIVNDLAFMAEKNSILAFPTEEMRDAFYENFKELIEEVKELL